MKKMISRRNFLKVAGASAAALGLAACGGSSRSTAFFSFTHLRAHETVLDLVFRLLLEKKKKNKQKKREVNHHE